MVNYGLTIVLIVDISIEVFSVYQQGTLLKSIGSAALQIQRTRKRFLEHAGGAQTVKKRGLDGWQHRSMAGFQQSDLFWRLSKNDELGWHQFSSLLSIYFFHLPCSLGFPCHIDQAHPNTRASWSSARGGKQHLPFIRKLGRSYVHQCIFTLDPED